MTLFERYGNNDKWERETSSDEERDVERKKNARNKKDGESKEVEVVMSQKPAQKRPQQRPGAKAPPPQEFFNYLLFLAFFSPEDNAKSEPLPLDPSDAPEVRADKEAISKCYPAFKSFSSMEAHKQQVFELVRSILPARSAISKFHEEMLHNKNFMVKRDVTPPKRALDAFHPDAQAPSVCVSNERVCIFTDLADLLSSCHCIYHFYDYASQVVEVRVKSDVQEMQNMSFREACDHIRDDPTLAKLAAIYEASKSWTK